jgi:hypothetical protein
MSKNIHSFAQFEIISNKNQQQMISWPICYIYYILKSFSNQTTPFQRPLQVIADYIDFLKHLYHKTSDSSKD